MVRQREEEAEAARSERLVSAIREDPEGLYDYVDRAYAEGPQILDGVAAQMHVSAPPPRVSLLQLWRQHLVTECSGRA
jgi:hypothetical protein